MKKIISLITLLILSFSSIGFASAKTVVNQSKQYEMGLAKALGITDKQFKTAYVNWNAYKKGCNQFLKSGLSDNETYKATLLAIKRGKNVTNAKKIIDTVIRQKTVKKNIDLGIKELRPYLSKTGEKYLITKLYNSNY